MRKNNKTKLYIQLSLIILLFLVGVGVASSASDTTSTVEVYEAPEVVAETTVTLEAAEADIRDIDVRTEEDILIEETPYEPEPQPPVEIEEEPVVEEELNLNAQESFEHEIRGRLGFVEEQQTTRPTNDELEAMYEWYVQETRK